MTWTRVRNTTHIDSIKPTIIDHITSGKRQAPTSDLCTKINDHYNHESLSRANADLEIHGPHLFTMGLVPHCPGFYRDINLFGTIERLGKRPLLELPMTAAQHPLRDACWNIRRAGQAIRISMMLRLSSVLRIRLSGSRVCAIFFD